MDWVLDRALDSRYLQEVVKAASGKPYDEKIAGMCDILFFMQLYLQWDHSGNGCMQDFRFYLRKQDSCQPTHHVAWTWIS